MSMFAPATSITAPSASGVVKRNPTVPRIDARRPAAVDTAPAQIGPSVQSAYHGSETMIAVHFARGRGITAVDPVRHGLLFERFPSEVRTEGLTEALDIGILFLCAPRGHGILAKRPVDVGPIESSVRMASSLRAFLTHGLFGERRMPGARARPAPWENANSVPGPPVPSDLRRSRTRCP